MQLSQARRTRNRRALIPRGVELFKGPGQMQVPVKVRCKLGHECRAVPYQWHEEHPEYQEEQNAKWVYAVG